MTDVLPHSAETEEALCARLLVDPAQVALIAGSLHPEDFYVAPYRDAYRAMLALSSRGDSIDLVTLQRETGYELPIEIANIGPAHRAPLEEYARIITRDAFRRRLIGSLDGVMRKAYVNEDQQQLLGDLQEAVSAVMAKVEDGHLLSPDQAVDAYLGLLRDRAAGRGVGLTWGIRPLDGFLKPAQGGEMIVVAARPSVGKTALAEQLADHWAVESQAPILFASLEMSLSQLLGRAAIRNSGVRLGYGRLDDSQLLAARTAADRRRVVHVWYLDDPFATTASIRSAAAQVRMVGGGLAAIVVDYIGLLHDAGDQETQRITKISRNLKAIAREFDVPLLVLAQLNRQSTMREDPHPRLSDLRDSGAIEQDADLVFGLHRALGTTELDADLLKNRHGEIKRVYLTFDPTEMVVR